MALPLDFTPDMLAAFFSLEPKKYAIRIAISIAAFYAAMDGDKTIKRAIGLAMLIGSGVLILALGLGARAVGDILLGLLLLAAAGYAWWDTRA